MHQEFAAVRMEPQPLWTRMLSNIWSRSFNIVPLVLPVLVLTVLWMLRPGELDLRTFLVTWFLAAPAGFSLWVIAWKTYGAGLDAGWNDRGARLVRMASRTLRRVN
ncbi:MAG: hypothetical protein P8J37_02090 [Fuerstiella sp.]|nr:hypothetical protein [Fuerstiella sp.]